jgi:DNA-binding CsgD family transcriptional regulator
LLEKTSVLVNRLPLDIERMFYYTFHLMSIWRLFKRWRMGPQQKKKKYSYILRELLHLKLTKTTAQVKRKRKKRASDSQAVSLPYDPNTDERYQLWIMLSPREQEVTALTCLKYTNPQIAARLGLSIETVRTYLEKVLNKFGLDNKADLRVLFAQWDFSEWERSSPQR